MGYSDVTYNCPNLSNAVMISVSTTRQSFDAPSPRNSREYPNIGLPYSSRNYRIIVLHLPLIVWVGRSSFTFFSGGQSLDKTISFSARVPFGRSRSSQVIDFGTNGKRVGLCDFLLIRHSNFGPNLHHFRDIAGFCGHDPTPNPPLFWGLLPLHQIALVGASPSIL